jgi:DNA gyrase subunit A
LKKSSLIEAIAQVIIARKQPMLLDVRDESTTDVRVVLEIKRDADPAMIMAYLYKHTPLQQNFNVNLTFLMPTDNPEVCSPARIDLRTALRHFLDFRLITVRRRFEFDLEELRRRIHILEGFAKIFDALDETIRIIRKSDGKADAADKLVRRFEIDDLQVEAILEMKLYKLARLEIDAILKELREKEREARRIATILKDEGKLWDVVKTELAEVREKFADRRRSKFGGVGDEPEFSEEAYIVAEDAHVVLTRDGWVKRVREVKDPTQTRVREGDEVVAVLSGSTRENVVFFSSFGSAYVTRINDIPPSTGYGDPVQKLFKFRDHERVVSTLSLDPRLGQTPMLLAVTRRGFGLRFALAPHSEQSTRAGRKFARVSDGDEIVCVLPVEARDVICVATEKAHVLLCREEDVNVLANPGKGVTVIKVAEGDRVIGVGIAHGASSRETPLTVESSTGRRLDIGPGSYEVTARGGKGRELFKRQTLKLVAPPVKVTTFTPPGVN